MSMINVMSVVVHDNPSPFSAPFKMEITFECLPPGLKEELEWKLTYVGSADDSKCDQELESVMVGPVVVGKNKFLFEAPGPDGNRIPNKDLLEVTVVLLTCFYKDKEFIRIGYYVNNEYVDPALIEAAKLPEHKVDFSSLRREVLADKPRVTRFLIPWDDTTVAELTPPPETMATEEDGSVISGNAVVTNGASDAHITAIAAPAPADAPMDASAD